MLLKWMPRMSFQNLKRFFNYDNQEVFQIGAQSVLPKCVHFRIIELAKFSAVDNTCDVTWLTTKRNYRVLKCDVIKNQNCEIMRFVGIFWKNSIQEAYLPKTSIVAQIVPEMLAQLCPLTRTVRFPSEFELPVFNWRTEVWTFGSLCCPGVTSCSGLCGEDPQRRGTFVRRQV